VWCVWIVILKRQKWGGLGPSRDIAQQENKKYLRSIYIARPRKE
jgi:hypothetical protein